MDAFPQKKKKNKQKEKGCHYPVDKVFLVPERLLPETLDIKRHCLVK